MNEDQDDHAPSWKEGLTVAALSVQLHALAIVMAIVTLVYATNGTEGIGGAIGAGIISGSLFISGTLAHIAGKRDGRSK